MLDSRVSWIFLIHWTRLFHLTLIRSWLYFYIDLWVSLNFYESCIESFKKNQIVKLRFFHEGQWKINIKQTNKKLFIAGDLCISLFLLKPVISVTRFLSETILIEYHYLVWLCVVWLVHCSSFIKYWEFCEEMCWNGFYSHLLLMTFLLLISTIFVHV